MTATTTRRAVLAGAAALPTLAIPAIASAADPADQADRLYRQYIAMVGEAKAISRATEEATAALPEWARMGPERVDSDGKFSGTTVGWPIREDLTYPAPGMLRNARPRTRDLSFWFEEDAIKWPEQREAARARYRKNMRAFVKRVREQRIEEERVGLPGLIAADEANYEKRWAIREAIGAGKASSNSVATLLLLNWEWQGSDIEVIAHLQPMLTGLVAEHVALVIAHAELKDSELPFNV